MASALITAVLLFLFQFQALSAENSDYWPLLIPHDIIGKQHSEDYCAMYDICGERSDGKVLNCPYGTPSVKPDELFSAKIQSLCPTISGNVCCTEAQFDTLRAQVQQAIPFLVGCPACLRNFLNLFCELSCSPHQSLFINVTSVTEVNENLAVDAIDFYVTDAFGEGLYDSCKDVKFGTMNTRAIEFIGAGARSFKEWFAFIGQQADIGAPGSPYSINFMSIVLESSEMEVMNVSTYSCADTSLGCSCGDCPSSPVCSDLEPPSPHEKDICSVSLGSLKVKCVELSLAILYVILVSLFLGWSFFQQKRERRVPVSSEQQPFLKFVDDGQIDSVNQEMDENPTLKLHGMGTSDVHLSVVQRYISSYYRWYGLWVARNPMLVLCSSVAVVLLLCVGLIHFRVETRPEKVPIGFQASSGIKIEV